MATQMQNNQNAPGSFDVKDEKGKLIAKLPDGASVVYSSTNDAIIKFVPNEPNGLIGNFTTEGDEVGMATVTGTVSYADGKTIAASQDFEVLNSPPSSAAFTVGAPVPDTSSEGSGGGQ